jgi:hypothetical protein
MQFASLIDPVMHSVIFTPYTTDSSPEDGSGVPQNTCTQEACVGADREVLIKGKHGD